MKKKIEEEKKIDLLDVIDYIKRVSNQNTLIEIKTIAQAKIYENSIRDEHDPTWF